VEPLVHRLGYVALNVVDLDACAQDAIQIAGAALVKRTPERALLTSNARHAELIMHRADANAIRAVGLEVRERGAVAEVARRAREAGLRVVTDRPSLEVIDEAVTFLTSEGHVIEVHTPMPLDRSARYPGPGVHPRFLDHVNLSAVDPETTAGELQRVTGVRLSERTPGYEFVWMRAGDGRHHTIACKKGPSGIHHYSWEFADFADFKRLADVLDTFGRNLSWGPGRHGAGDNIFAYYIDAGGFMVENTAEMEVITDPDFPGRVSDPGEDLVNVKVVNRWGQRPSAEWLAHNSAFAVPTPELVEASHDH
jgi:catechol 2,3-dioxygenase